MGCAVNGPGEAREADIGIAGGKGEALLFKKGEIVRKIKQEDIIEELVGEIWDETDKIEEDFTKKNENTYIVEGDMNIYDLWEMLEYENDEFDTEYTTVGGFCTEKLERFPKVNDTFDFDHFRFTILEVDEDGVRVDKVKVEVLEIEEDEE